MPRHFIKDVKTGTSRLVYVEPNEVKPVEITQPAVITLAGTQRARKYKCKLCEKKFATIGVFSIHYKHHHKVTDDKNEYRTQYETLDGADGK